MNPDRLAALEDERRYLLRSLRDLETEHDAGDVDDTDYEILRDDYTKRAADVLRSIESGRAEAAARPRRRWTSSVATAAVVVAVGLGAGWLVARSSGERGTGQTMTGNDPRPGVAQSLTEARLSMGQDPLAALEAFDRVLAEEPDQAEALTYRGWLLYTTLGRSDLGDASAEAIADARESLARAVAADPTYADPHCFLAIIAARVDEDTATARAEADTCLALRPPAAARAMIERFRAELDAPTIGSTVPATSDPAISVSPTTGS